MPVKQVDLPEPPSYLNPVGKPPLEEGMSAYVAARQARDRVELADCRLQSARSWYDSLKAFYASGGEKEVTAEADCATR